MLTTLHLLLGQRRPHELPAHYLSRDRMLLLHSALLKWLVTGTPPTLWDIGCLTEDIIPPPQATTGPYTLQSVAKTVDTPKGTFWRPTYSTPHIRATPESLPLEGEQYITPTPPRTTTPHPIGRSSASPREKPKRIKIGTTHSLRTKHVEALCKAHIPELSKKIVCVVDRRILRQSPKTEAFLL